MTTPQTSTDRPQRARIAVELGAMIVLATTVHTWIALRSPSPWIVPDELIYSELAKSLGSGSEPSIRGETSFSWGLGYPLLLAPLWAALDDVESAYALARPLNATLMSITAIPAYLFARRFVSMRLALIAAALSLSAPFLLYSGTLMTEVALYPAVAFALLAITVAVERGGPGAQLAVFASIAIACLIKALAIVLLPAYVIGVLVHWALESRSGERELSLRRYRVTWLALAIGAGTVLMLVLGSGRSPIEILGTYETVLEHLRPTTIPGWIAAHAGELAIAVAVIPLAATITVWCRAIRRESTREVRLFFAVSAPVVACWLIAVGTYASVPFLETFEYPENVARLQGRSTFMLAVPLFVGFAIWLGERRAGRTVVGIAAITTFALPVLIPFDRVDENVRFQSLPLVPWVDAQKVGVLAFAAALIGVFLLGARTRLAGAGVVIAVLIVFVFVSISAHRSMLSASRWTRDAAATGSSSWVDDTVGPEASVAVLWAEPPGKRIADLERDQRQLFIGEFFNRSIGTVYELGSPLPYGLPSVRARLDNGVVVLASGAHARLGSLILAPCHVVVSGELLAHDAGTGAAVWRVRDPVRVQVGDPSACGERSPS